MFSFRRPAVIASLVLAGAFATGLAACATEPDKEEAPSAEEVRRQRHGAVNAVITAAIEAAELTPAQLTQLESIQSRIKERREGRSEVREEMRAAASEIVRDGTTDSQLYDEVVERASKLIEAKIELSTADAVEIHGMLSAEQRSRVAEVLRERVDKKWGKVRRDRHEGLEEFAEDLALSDEQKAGLKKIRDEMMGQNKRLRPTPEEVYGMIDAFEGEDFAEALAAFAAEKAPLLRQKIAEAGNHADAVLELLEPSQRDLLADIIEDGYETIRAEK
jgi:hypothetical protein